MVRPESFSCVRFPGIQYLLQIARLFNICISVFVRRVNGESQMEVPRRQDGERGNREAHNECNWRFEPARGESKGKIMYMNRC